MAVQLSKDSIDIGIVTRNADAMLEFYRDVVGCEFQGEMVTPTTSMQRLLCGTSLIKIVTPNNLSDTDAPPGGIGGATGYRYWTISVSNLDEIAQKCADAGRKVTVKPTEIRPGVRIAMVEDPDGNWLEFLERLSTMKISTLLSYAGGFKEAVKEIRELEQAGLDVVWVPEAYSFDAPSAMGYLAANTERVVIASGILPIYSRTPTLLAMTAAGIDYLSDGRCMLGLGASGPQVIEGFHGVPYTAPVARIREIIEICRMVWRRERVQHMGRHYQIPLPQNEGTGLGKPLKLINHPVRDDIPIAVASLGPKSVAMTAELADAWLPAFYTAEAANDVWGKALTAGAAKRDPSRAPLDIYAGGAVAIGEGREELRDLARPGTALYVGGMGARSKNFYNDIFSRSGYAEEARLIQDLYLSGDKKAAEAAIPASYLEKNSLIGAEGFVAERLAALKESGVTSLNVSFVGETLSDRVAMCENLRKLADDT